MMFRRLLDAQFMIFIAGGIVSAILDICILQIMIFMGYVNILSVTVGFFGGLIVNFGFHVKLTFKSVTSFLILIRFLLVVLVNYLITVAFVMISFSFLENVLVGKIASLPIIAINGFLLSKYWVFKNSNSLS